jgi:hypothetical protein
MAELVYLDEYKIYKGLTSTEDDARREQLILQVSDIVETYCNRKFIDYSASPGITEYYSALNTEVWLTHFPILEVTYVGVSVDGGQTYTELTEDSAEGTGFFVYHDEGKISTQKWDIPFAYYVQHPHKSLKVTYRAGYEGVDNIPLDLKGAIYDLVHYYEHSEHTVSKSLNAATLENPMPYNNINFPPHITRILNQYRVPYNYMDAMG